jgi:hypothetical protein
MRRRFGIEYPPYGGYRDAMGLEDAWGDIGAFITVKDVTDVGLGLLSGGGGVLLPAVLMPRIPGINRSAVGMGAATTVLGILGGFLLTKLHRETGVGFAAGAGGYGLATMIADLVGIDLSMKAVPAVTAAWGKNLLIPGAAANPALRNALVEPQRLFGSPTVQKVPLANAVVEPQVLYANDEEEEPNPGSWLY